MKHSNIMSGSSDGRCVGKVVGELVDGEVLLEGACDGLEVGDKDGALVGGMGDGKTEGILPDGTLEDDDSLGKPDGEVEGRLIDGATDGVIDGETDEGEADGLGVRRKNIFCRGGSGVCCASVKFVRE